MQVGTIADKVDWLETHRAFMKKEKDFQKARDALSKERRSLPWMSVDKNYDFQSETGVMALSDLFEGRSQLIIWHFMFGSDWQEGCPSCSFWADQYSPTTVHLNQRGVSLAAVSTAPIDTLIKYRRRMGWSFPWVSSSGSDFNRDFAVTFSEGETTSGDLLYNHETLPAGGQELPGLTVFAKADDGAIYRTYSTYARGLDPMNTAYQHLDLVPNGRDEGGLPWPMAWLRRHDQYDAQ